MCFTTFAASTIYACRFAPGYRLFELNPRAVPLSGDAPAPPEVRVQLLKRGFDDGDFASCSDAVVLTIELGDGEADRKIGYIFTIESGPIHDKKLPDEVVAPIELSDGRPGFYFVWLDYGTNITATLKIQSVSTTGVEGGVSFLAIDDP